MMYKGWWYNLNDGLTRKFLRQEMDDTIREKPTLERKREWAHGLEGKGKNCDRYDKRIYTPPESVPDTCHDWNCDNTEYQSKGIVTRNKATKEIVDREDNR